MALFVGDFIQKLTSKIKEISPDMILLLGDRGEMLGAAIVSTYLGIPIAHSHGGDVSSTVDEQVRHAITKLAHIHFPATEKSAERIIKMGEDPNNVHIVGSPGLDVILNEKDMPMDELKKRIPIDFDKQFIVMLQHSVPTEPEKAVEQVTPTLEAIKELGIQLVIIYPNSDAGGRAIIEKIKEYESLGFVHTFKNLDRSAYLSLMKRAAVQVGNSSSGMIESASFKLPVVNIGTRQFGRERADNVIDVDYDKEQIKAAVQKALTDDAFKKTVKNCKNPYGDGTAAKKIVNVLSKVKIDKNLIQKRITYK